MEVTVEYNTRCVIGADSNNAQSTPTAPAAVSGGGAHSGHAAQQSTPAAVGGVNSTQNVQDAQTDSTAAANVTGGDTPVDSSTANSGAAVKADVVYTKNDVLKEKGTG